MVPDYPLAVTILEVIQRSSHFLEGKGVESPRLQSELLLAHVLQLPRLSLYLNFDRSMTDGELASTRALIQRRGAREPLQHLVGSTSFCGLEIRVTPEVFIPRPETEQLAERAWQYLDGLPAGSLRVLDYACGSGCLAIAMTFHCARATALAVDISERALAVARENALRHGVAGRIDFLAGESLPALLGREVFDLIVSNPPYIPTGEIPTLQPEVRDHDPVLALDGGRDGLDFYRRLAAESDGLLRAGGKLMLELGDGQSGVVSGILTENQWTVEQVVTDYSGRERVLIASRLKSLLETN